MPKSKTEEAYDQGARDARHGRDSDPPKKSMWNKDNPPERGAYQKGYADEEKKK